MKKSSIGGQAVIEGVMMKSPTTISIAVRKPDSSIEVKKEKSIPLSKRYKVLGIPIVRGFVNFLETLVTGVKILTDSAKMYGEGLDDSEEYEPSKFEKFIAEKTGANPDDIMTFFAVIFAVAFAILLFVIVPSVLANLLKPIVKSSLAMNFIDGIIRLIIFLLYIYLITFIKDIKRVFQYHGAEHKVIHCYEHEKELTVENARKFTTLHPRCGTSFLLIVVLISIIVFAFLGWDKSWLIRVVTRILLLPVVAGISYEILKWAGRSDSTAVKIVSWPGLMLQKLTTSEPDDSMLEVAIVAFENCLPEMDGTNGAADVKKDTE